MYTTTLLHYYPAPLYHTGHYTTLHYTKLHYTTVHYPALRSTLQSTQTLAGTLASQVCSYDDHRWFTTMSSSSCLSHPYDPLLVLPSTSLFCFFFFFFFWEMFLRFKENRNASSDERSLRSVACLFRSAVSYTLHFVGADVVGAFSVLPPS